MAFFIDCVRLAEAVMQTVFRDDEQLEDYYRHYPMNPKKMETMRQCSECHRFVLFDLNCQCVSKKMKFIAMHQPARCDAAQQKQTGMC